jgi:LuxR family maltose regulon positive regulatory protein
MSNDLEAAASDLEGASDVGDVPRSAREAERIALARLLVAREDHDEALRLLDRSRETAEAADGRSGVIEILALQALALWAESKREAAVSTLAEALALAEPEGYVRTFVDEGPPMAELLSGVLEAQQRGRPEPVGRIPAPYLRKLLAASERDAPGAASPAAGLPEPLSERELEVLQLIAAGKTNRRIASELFVSVGTVKTHINNVYRKLDAHSRTQALARARELRVL